MDKERWGGEEEKQGEERLQDLKDKEHKILSLFEIIKDGEKELESLQDEQLQAMLQDDEVSEVNYSFLLELLRTLREFVHDSMVSSWENDDRIEILPEIFFYQTSQEETPTVKRVFENLARLFRQEGPTSQFFQTPQENSDFISLLSEYKRQRFDEAVALQKKNRRRGKGLTPEQNKELLLVQEKYNLLTDIIKNLDTKELLPHSTGKISLADLFFILADLIEEQVELLTVK